MSSRPSAITLAESEPSADCCASALNAIGRSVSYSGSPTMMPVAESASATRTLEAPLPMSKAARRTMTGLRERMRKKLATRATVTAPASRHGCKSGCGGMIYIY